MNISFIQVKFIPNKFAHNKCRVLTNIIQLCKYYYNPDKNISISLQNYILPFYTKSHTFPTLPPPHTYAHHYSSTVLCFLEFHINRIIGYIVLCLALFFNIIAFEVHAIVAFISSFFFSLLLRNTVSCGYTMIQFIHSLIDGQFPD